MRAATLAVIILLLPCAAQGDIIAACYTDCEAETDSNPEFKACLSRAANKADRLLNQSYEALQDAIRAAAKEMNQSAESQLGSLSLAQKQWIEYRDLNCTFEDELAFGGTASGGNYSGCLCALSYERINDFDRIPAAGYRRVTSSRGQSFWPLETLEKARILSVELMIGFDQEWAFARSFLLGSTASPCFGEEDSPPPMSSSADKRFVRETEAERQIADLAEPVLEELGFRLVRVKVSGRDGGTVQIMAERLTGEMTVEDCATISRRLSPVLDAYDPMPGAYRLEVSSPGIDRPLVRSSDFALWAGHEAKIELKELVDGRKRFRGVIEGVEDDEVRLRMELDGKAEPIVIGLPFSLISEAKLVADMQSFRADLSGKKPAH